MDDLSAVQAKLSAALVSTTRATSQIAAQDVNFHRSLDPSVGAQLDRQNGRLLGLATRLLASASANSETVRPPSLRDIDGIEANWRAVVDVVDSLLERTDTALDEFAGAVKRLSPGAAEQLAKGNATSRPASFGAVRKISQIEKPQLLFEHPPDNRSRSPFRPLLQMKPHALRPLSTEPTPATKGLQEEYPHPYQVEIEQYEYPPSIYTTAGPIPYKPFEETTAIFVDTEEALQDMLQELKRAKEIAVDLEHHDQRSYTGIVCLMQISTRDQDWIVDTLKPWRRRLQCLNEVFADPKIVKVLHGAFMDVVWLQRDLGLYLVGLFDTHHAARELGYAGGSLAFLLKKFVNVDAQKQYQMADWRVRPLPQELFDYARSDTHYLLYIFDCMRNELIEGSDFLTPNQVGDLVFHVLQRSNEVALKKYETPLYDPELGQGAMGWYKLLFRTSTILSKEQFGVFRALHQWRDDVAREQDDSINYIMPNHQIFSIARDMPSTKAALLGVAQPASPAVRLRADELVGVVVRATEANVDGPNMMDVLNSIEPQPYRNGASSLITNSHSVASFVPKKDNVHATNGSPSILGNVRSAVSSFWRGTFETSAHQKRPLSTASEVAFSIPLPPLTAEVFTDGPQNTSEESQTPAQPLATRPSPPREPVDIDIFTLNQMNRKRKHGVGTSTISADGMAAQRDEVSISDDQAAERARSKAERKSARKAEKRARKNADAGDVPVNSSDAQAVEEEPFDYASAPSMLTQRAETKEEMKARKKKEVNPYAKAMETSKGLPRVQKERAGRSMTYK